MNPEMARELVAARKALVAARIVADVQFFVSVGSDMVTRVFKTRERLWAIRALVESLWQIGWLLLIPEGLIEEWPGRVVCCA